MTSQQFVFLFFSLTALLLPHHSFATQPVHIERAYTLALPPTAKNAAVYLQLNNTSSKTVRLISASTNVAKKVEFHDTVHNHDVIHMEKTHTVKIPAHSSLQMHPGKGLHIMLMGLKKSLINGETFPIDLIFSDNMTASVNVEIKKPDASHSH